MTRLRRVAASLALGTTIFMLSLPIAGFFELLGSPKVASIFASPLLVFTTLLPCLALGSKMCAGDAILSGMHRWSIALGIGVYASLSYLLLTVTRGRPLTIGSSDRGAHFR